MNFLSGLFNNKLPPETREKIKKLNQQLKLGELALRWNNSVSACQAWLEAWESIKTLATPQTRSLELFQQAYPGINQEFFEFPYELLQELHNAGRHDPSYHATCITYVHEFLEVFPLENEDEDILVNFGRAEGESLWELGRIAESEAVYAALVERIPDQGWAYIGWADQYWLWDKSPKKYAQAETILKRALSRRNLQDRADVLDRLVELYDEWGKPTEADAAQRKLDALLEPQTPTALSRPRHKKKKK